MPGAGSKVTPNRKTHVRLDIERKALMEPPFSCIRLYDEIGRGPDSVIYQCELGTGGWTLESYRATQIQTLSAAEAAVLGIGTGPLDGWQVASSNVIQSVDKNRKRTELTGASYASGVHSSGDKFLTPKVGASQSFADMELTADAAATVGVGPTSHPELNWVATSYRAAVSLQVHEQQSFNIRITLPRAISDLGGHVCSIMFCGPAGYDEDFVGYGQYELWLAGNGTAWLLEYGLHKLDAGADGEQIFKHRAQFKWADRGAPSGTTVDVRVRIYKRGELVLSPSGLIIIEPSVNDRPLRNSSLTQAAPVGKKSQLTQGGYKPPSTLSAQANSGGWVSWGSFMAQAGKTRPTNLRLNLPSDARPEIQLSFVCYKPSGYIKDGFISFPFYPSDVDSWLTLSWWGLADFAKHTIEPILYLCDSTGEETILTEETTERTDYSRTYKWLSDAPVNERTRLFARFNIATSDTLESPVIFGYQLVRDGKVATIDPTEFEPKDFPATDPPIGTSGWLLHGGPMNIQITGQGSNPTLENASTQIADLVAQWDRLSSRGYIGGVIESEYDAGDAAKRVPMFRGFIHNPIGKLIGTKGGPGRATAHAAAGTNRWPNRNAKMHECTWTGMWQLVREALSPCRFDWNGLDPESPKTEENPNGLPYKATDALLTMLGWCGFPSSMIATDEFDLPLRLWSNGGQELFVEPFAPLDEFIERIARDWLGMRLIFDPAVGDYGKWRLLPAPTAPYTNLATFTTKPPVTTRGLVHNINAYDSGVFAGTRKTSNYGFILKGTLQSNVKRLEGNLVIVTGTGFVGEVQGGQVALQQFAINVRSYNFLDLASDHEHYPDPDHPDYIGHMVPIVVVDPGLTTQDDVDWVCKRVFEVACFSRKRVTFTAPLLFINDASDTELGTDYRMLRYYDPVLLEDADGNTTQWLVVSCNPGYKKDGQQWAEYELEAPREAFL